MLPDEDLVECRAFLDKFMSMAKVNNFGNFPRNLSSTNLTVKCLFSRKFLKNLADIQLMTTKLVIRIIHLKIWLINVQ